MRTSRSGRMVPHGGKSKDVFDRQLEPSGRPAAVVALRDAVDNAEMYSRNWAFIAPEAQAALRNKVIFAAGSGLSSTVLGLACRTGFTRFIVADGDNVELSNLNRQAFSYAQINRNKAEATAEMLRGIRPDVDVTVLPEFLHTH